MTRFWLLAAAAAISLLSITGARAQTPSFHFGSDTRPIDVAECMRRAKEIIGVKGFESAIFGNSIIGSGAKVVVATVPNLGITPFGQAENAAHTDTSRAVLLATLTARFNALMRATIINDCRQIGLILFDEYIEGVIAVSTQGELIALAEAEQGELRPRRIFNLAVGDR